MRTRIFVGDQIDDCKDLSGLYYLLPFQKVRESCNSDKKTNGCFNVNEL